MDQPQATQPAPPAPRTNIFLLLRDIIINPGAAFTALKLSPAPPVWKLLALLLAAFALYCFHMRLPTLQARAPLAPFVTIAFGDINPAAIPSLLAMLALSAVLTPLLLHPAARLLGGKGGLKTGMAGFYLAALAALAVNMALNLAFVAANLFGYLLLGCSLWFLVLCALHLRYSYGLSPLLHGFVLAPVFGLLALLQLVCAVRVTMPYIKRAMDLSKKLETVPRPLIPQFGDGQENAAGLYRHAADKLARINDKDRGRASTAIFYGFTDEDGSLAAMLERQAEALDYFRKAAAVPHCNFAALSMKEKTSASALPFPDELTTLPLLTLVEARAFQAQGRLDLALDRLLAVVSAADHLGQQANFILAAALYRKELIDRLYTPAADLLAGRKLQEEDCRLLLRKLDSALIRTRPFGDALRERAELTLAGAEPLVKEYAAIFREPAAGTIVKDYLALQDGVLESLSAAAAHNAPGKYTEFMAGLTAETADIHKLYFGKKPSLTDCVWHPAKLPACCLAFRMSDFPDLAPIVGPYFVSEIKLKLLATAAAIRVYEFRYGRPPGSLNDLAPEYLTGLPLDTFASDVLKYSVKQDGAWLLYSVGPDRHDDNGAMECKDEEWDGAAGLPGDLVFRSSAPEKKPASKAKKKRTAAGGQ